MNPNKKKMTVPDFKKFKAEGRKFTFVTAYDYTMASIINDSETEVILVGDSMAMVVLGRNSTVGVTVDDIIHHTAPVVLGAPQTFVIGDMPFGSYNVSVAQAIESANRILMETNCDAVKLEGGKDMAPAVESMVKAGISVVGHIGLTPQTSVSFGGFKVQGKRAEAARQLLDEAAALEDAGCFAIVLEAIPAPLAAAITARVSVPTIGIGAGADCDGQVLVLHDMLGLYSEFTPRFVKRYAELGTLMEQAVRDYAEEVRSGAFPTPAHSFSMDEEERARLEDRLRETE